MYVVEGEYHFPSSVVLCPVMEHEQQFNKHAFGLPHLLTEEAHAKLHAPQLVVIG